MFDENIDNKNPDNFPMVGHTLHSEFDKAIVMTTDSLREAAGGISKGAILVAMDEGPVSNLSDPKGEVLILRVEGTAALPSDNAMMAVRQDRFRRILGPADAVDYDPITANQIQEGALACVILGTYYLGEHGLELAADVESVMSSGGLKVYKPQGRNLEELVNHRNLDQLDKAVAQAAALGIPTAVSQVELGKVQFSSAAFRQQHQSICASFLVNPLDFLANRTALFGMTTTGKSNAVKLIVEITQMLQELASLNVGQLIIDRRGEYSHVNHRGVAISEKFPDATELYSFADRPGFKSLKPNFYAQPAEGLAIIKEYLRSRSNSSAVDINNFMELELVEPLPDADYGERKRYARLKAAFLANLYQAGYEAPDGFKVEFDANAKVRVIVDQEHGAPLPNPKFGLTLADAVTWFTAARSANSDTPLRSTTGEPWVDANLEVLLNMIVSKNKAGGYFNGHRVLGVAVNSHSIGRSQELLAEIYGHLVGGRIVILDISDDRHGLSEKLGERIARMIIRENEVVFKHGDVPPHIQIYVEEAHHLIPKHGKLTDPWLEVAKEGNKFNVGFIYATQEPSSIHHNILSNTENWFMFHLNSKDEVKALAEFEDFEFFADSMRRVSEVGLAWVRTKSNHFTTPVKLRKFVLGTEIDQSVDIGG